MKLPGIFELTRREQRAVVLIMIALLTAAVVKRYRDQQTPAIPAQSAPVETLATPSATSSKEAIVESELP